jgi:hypothetical protein
MFACLNLGINLSALFDKLFGFLFQSFFQRFVFADPLVGCVLPHVLTSLPCPANFLAGDLESREL